MNVASVSDLGLVNAKAEGTAYVTASFGEKAWTVNIVVRPNSATSTVDIEEEIPLQEILFEQGQSVTLVIGDDYTLKPTAYYGDGSRESSSDAFVWRSTFPEIAEVDNSGKLFAKNSGTTDVTARIGEKLATILINVLAKEPPVKQVQSLGTRG